MKRLEVQDADMPLNKGHFIEMLDRLHVAIHTIDEHMLNHYVAESYEGIKLEIMAAIDHLSEAYQSTGAASREFKDET